MRLIINPLLRSRVALQVPFYHCFSTGSMLSSVAEVQEGSRFIEERNIPAAVEHLERAIQILPFYQVGDASYNSEFDEVVSNLIQAYAWQADQLKVSHLVQRAISTNLAGKQIVRASEVLAAIGLQEKQSWQSPRIQAIHKNLLSLKLRGVPTSVERLYNNNAKSDEALGEWEQGNIGEAAGYLLSTLQYDQSFANKKGFNSFCSSFLKQCERGSPKNVIKALIIMNCNTLRKEQFLQSEGLLNYCIDRKKQNVKAPLLAVNQQYHLLQLLMARVYTAVDRQEEAKRLVQQHQPVFNWEMLMLQTLLIDSI